ncbi:MAG: hypothetical protein LBU81_04800 [Methanosarcinales archaeon]|jgi:hypothetical protein|nr:hypothetical protein [Methanosarcinales archaeon]
MVQTEAAMEAYNIFWADSLVPYSEYMWMIAILVISLLALWQARVFIKDF